MKKTLVAIAFGALLSGCEQPGFDEDINTYAPACENKPHVAGTFDEFSIDCGEYHLEQRQTDSECTSTLDRYYENCHEQWHNGNCNDDNVLDYWSITCPVYDEDGILISSTNEYSRLPTHEQNQRYKAACILIGYEAARQRWVEWNEEQQLACGF